MSGGKASIDATVKGLVQQLRVRLLDTSNRNRLVSFKHSDRARTHVRVIDELPDVLFDRLTSGKALTFKALPEMDGVPADEQTDSFLTALEAARASDQGYLTAIEELGDDESSPRARKVERELRDRVRRDLGLPPRKAKEAPSLIDHARAQGIDPSYDLPLPLVGDEGADKHFDGEIQTLLLPDAMERKLSAIREQFKTSLQETGINTLYCVCGFLEWFESESSSKPLLAPLLLLPIEMDRRLQQSRYRYSITATGEEVSLNLTLSERLYQDFSMRLPEVQDEDTPETYFQKVQAEVCAHKPGWRVRRYVTVGHFAFARLVMYHDLDDKRWPEGQELSKRAVIRDLLAGTEADGPMFAEEYDIDTKWVATQVPVLVTDADSSQHSAIADVMNGRNLVIEGPPGTGKSQTITNIIAAALSLGKRVLFVAEKMAALEVVKSRLDKAGIGDFCLELHSTKAKKKDVLDALDRRLKLTGKIPQPVQLSAELTELESLKARLGAYVELLNSPWGQGGKTLHEVLWTCRRLQADDIEGASEVDRLKIVDAKRLTPSAMNEHMATLETLEEAGARLQCETDQHPWRWVKQPHMSPFDQEAIIRLMRSCVADIESILEARDAIENALDIALPQELAPLNVGLTFLRDVALGPSDLAPARPFLADGEARDAIREWIRQTDRHALASEEVTRLGGSQALGQMGSDALKAVLDEAVSDFGRLQLGRLAVRSLPEKSEQLRTQANELERAASHLKRAVRLLFASEPTVSSCRAAIAAIELARSADRQALPLMTADILHPDSRDLIQLAAERCACLRKQRESFDERFAKPAGLDSLVIRGHAATLRDAGFFSSFFSSSVRSAKSFYSQVAKSPAGDKLTMARELTELADHMDASAEFLADEGVRAIFGRHDRGLDTNFEVALICIEWGDRVRQSLSLEDDHVAARGALLRGDRELLEALQAMGDGAEFERAKAILFREALPDGNVSTLVSDWRAEADEVLQLHQAIVGCGLPDGATVHDLVALQRQLDELHHAAGGRDSAFSRIPGSCQATVRTASAAATEEMIKAVEALMGMRLPERVSSLLLSADSHERLEGCRERLEFAIVLVAKVSGALDALKDHAKLDAQALFTNCKDISAIKGKLDEPLLFEEQLGAWSDWLSARQRVLDIGLSDFLSLWERQVVTKDLVACYRRAFYRSLAEQAFNAHPEISRFSGLDLQQARQRFRELDRKILNLQSQALAAELCRKPMVAGVGQGKKSEYTDKALILAEIAKQRKHIPIRELLDRAGTAVQQMKPCFMMSPISVAQFLKPDGLAFDLLVIDEASQMRPEDALGAMARCAQIVVVGDPKQLPPSSFFDRLDSGMDEDENEEDSIQSESILDLSLSVFRPARRLRWHYRSRHGGLVAFSNKEFYDGELIVFPSPFQDHSDLGVKLVPVQGVYKGRVNVPEVAAVAEQARDFMHRYPNLSLGIVALNQPQRDLICDEMDRIFARDSKCEAYRAKWEETLEPFFVKNLENVQGDERDAIFISGVYGPNENGQVLQRFGPINGAHGHRRLNVLFTRAKHQVRLFSSLKPEDIKITETSSRGVRALRGYLEYALTGRLEAGQHSGREPDSDFEIWVKEQLLAKGYQVDHQVGVAGFYLDLAVRHPDHPGIYLMGIECDGATYHRSRSARDRDRLRQDVLEALGWKIYRVWSTDWFKQPRNELQRMVKAIEAHRQEFRLPDFATATTTTLVAPAQPDVVAEREPRLRSERPPHRGAPEPRQMELLVSSEPTHEAEPKRVRVTYSDGTATEALFLGFEPDGRLRLQLNGGVVIRAQPDSVAVQAVDEVGSPPSIVKPDEAHAAGAPCGGISREDARRKLIAFRENTIMKAFPKSDRTKGLLRDRMLHSLLKHLPQDLEEFRAEIPLALRQETDSEQMKFLAQVLEIITQVSE